MSTDQINVDEFKTVYKAQTEAYLEFHKAIINLLTNQREILLKLDKHDLMTDEEFRKLSKELYAIDKLFSDFQNRQEKRDHDIEGSVDDFKASITHFHESIEALSKEIASVKKLQWDQKNFWLRIVWSLGGVLAFMTVFQLLTGKGILP